MDDFDDEAALAACVILSEALRCCGTEDNIGPVLQAMLSGFEAVASDWELDPAEQRCLWRQVVVRRELKTQLKLLERIGPLTRFDGEMIKMLRKGLTSKLTAEKILSASHPDVAKKLGREAKGFDEAKWVEHRFEIVVRGNEAKFGQNAALKQFLLNTGQRVLVEASPVDRVWGIGLAEDNPEAANPEQWPGLNLLGFALMKVRRQFSSGKAA
jgi:ribA/ribD-fused uncharacterized protein